MHNADGSYFVDRQRRVLDWQLPVINSSNKSGSLECNVPGEDANGFFPVMVSFVSERLICDVDVRIQVDGCVILLVLTCLEQHR